MVGAWNTGCIFVVLVALIWNFSTVLVQTVFDEWHFDEPFVLTYVANSLFVINLFTWACLVCCGAVQNPRWRRYESSGKVEGVAGAAAGNGEDEGSEPLVSHEEHLRIAMVMWPLWLGANLMYNYSLANTSNASSTIISTTTSLWAFGFAVASGTEASSNYKAAGVALCLAGACVIGWQDTTTRSPPSVNQTSSDTAGDSIQGDLLALAGALLSGLYTATLARQCPGDHATSMALVFGYIGLLNAVCLAPLLPCLHAAGWVGFQGLTGKVFAALLAKGLFDNVLADYLWARAVVLTSPTVASVGLALTIPMAVASDAARLPGSRPLRGGWAVGLGALLVLGGFGLVNGVCARGAGLPAEGKGPAPPRRGGENADAARPLMA